MVSDINKMLKQTKKLLSKMVRGERGLNSHTAAGDRALIVLKKADFTIAWLPEAFHAWFPVSVQPTTHAFFGLRHPFLLQPKRTAAWQASLGRLWRFFFPRLRPSAEDGSGKLRPNSLFQAFRQWGAVRSKLNAWNRLETEGRPRTRKNSDQYTGRQSSLPI